MSLIANIRESVLDAREQTLVCPVNCVGVMGAGIALAFADKYPYIVSPYREMCRSGELKIGVVKTLPLDNDKQVLLFPTKNHFKENSKLRYLIDGLTYLLNNADEFNIESLAMVPLGCGCGKLSYATVRMLLQEYLVDLPFPSRIYLGVGNRTWK